ncbi:MAG: M3 family metallopeptidase [Verrucomicrobiota bacterium]|nr:M3 family metallopeptidase [Verrucomicrobiota bacterium]
MNDVHSNPLLKCKGLPNFSNIFPEHVEPAITFLLEDLEKEFSRLESGVQPTWVSLVEPLDQISARLEWTWGVVSHLVMVKNSPEWRKVHEAMEPKIVAFSSRAGQSRPLYEAYVSLKSGSDWATCDVAQKRIVESYIRDAELSGVALTGGIKERFNAVQIELADLATKFSNNVLDATKSFDMDLTTKEEVSGLPPSLLSLASQISKNAGMDSTPETGPWRITLDFPAYGPFMQHSRRRDLREKVFRAFVGRASEGESNNNPLIERILALRQEKARLLGYNSFAELSLSRKMALSVSNVENLLEELRAISFDAAHREFDELRQYAKAEGAAEGTDFQPWDAAFWSERHFEKSFGFTDEQLRPYFALPNVLDGLFGLTRDLFGMTVEPADGEAPVWHPDVRFFRIYDDKKELVASFYLDSYSRPQEKQGGAWMDKCIGRAKGIEEGKSIFQKPVAYLICNQTPPVDDKPSLMTFREVETLFHEFGHGLQHMLTKVDYPAAAGINNVEWDAVELPSQFMENWCYDRETLFGMAKHWQTGEVLPEEFYQKLLTARKFMSGSGMLRQIHLGLVDIELHHRYEPGGKETPSGVRRRLAVHTTVMAPISGDEFLCAFSHIFAGGYAAGYYSYKWAEVLSADAFSAFEEVGLENRTAVRELGFKFRDTILGLGGGLHPMEVYRAFRGRDPESKALLKQAGLLKQ